MPRLTIGTEPIQVAWRNPNRRILSVQFLPSSIVAGNTGLVYGKFGSAPIADPNSNTWDFVLNSGASDGTNIDGTLPKAEKIDDLWLTADTATQIVNVREENVQ